MASVLNRVTKKLIASVNSPDYSIGDWIINPDMGSVGSDPKTWWITGDTVREMTDAEKDANILPDVQTTKMDEIDARTRELILEGFEYPASSGDVFSLSDAAQRTLEGIYPARNEAAIVYPVEWNLLDNSGKISLADAAAVSLFYLTAVGVVRGHKDAGTALKDQIRAATTVATVDAVADSR